MIEPHQYRANLPDIIPCPPDKRREALLQLAAAHDPAQHAALSTALKRTSTTSDEEWQGLLVNYQQAQITGAIWIQRLPGNMAQLWLPFSGVKAEQTHALLRAAHAWVKGHNIRLCHVEILPHADTQALLIEHGMQRLAYLQHLVGSSGGRLAMNSAISLSLQPLCDFSQPQQLGLLAAVGHDSLDSRALREALSVEELFAGFYQQDPLAPQHWYAVGYQAEIVGVLLLAPRPAMGRWELMLMGLTPAWRGQGLGRALLNKALELAQQSGVKEMVLAVDEANHPAKRLYQQAGFVRYAQQRLLAWKGDSNSSEAPK